MPGDHDLLPAGDPLQEFTKAGFGLTGSDSGQMEATS